MTIEEATRIIRDASMPLSPIDPGLATEGECDDPIRAVVFDIYGTLFISTSGDISLAEKEASRSKGLDNLLAEYTIYEDAKSVLARFFKEIERTHEAMKREGVSHPEVEVNRVWQHVLPSLSDNDARTFALRYEMIVNPVYPMPGLKETLQEISAQGVPMGIVSNAQFFTPYLFPAFLGKTLPELGFDKELLFYSYNCRFAKPSPCMYRTCRKALEAKGVASEHVLYVGNDMLNDITPATTVGFRTALFAGDTRSLRERKGDPRCEGVTPTVIVKDLRDLLRYV